MSPRTQFPSAREPDTHFFCTISRGGRQRRFSVRPAVVYAATALLPLVGAIYLGATGYLFFRDDMVAAMMTRQAKLQYAYEDRIAALRIQMDHVTSRQLLDQDSFESRVQQLAARQSQLETRTAIVVALGERVGGPDMQAAQPPRGNGRIGAAAEQQPRVSTRPTPATGGPITPPVSAFAPGPEPFSPAVFPHDKPVTHDSKPRPDGFELRTNSHDLPARSSALEGAPRDLLADAIDSDLPMPTRLETLAAALDRTERRQILALTALADPALRKVDRLKSALAEAGLSPDKIVNTPDKGGVGGPFTPMKTDTSGSLFARQLNTTQGAVAALDRLRRALPYIPLRRPLNTPIEVSSTFGYRVDPFLGRAALHSGMDMRAETGTLVYATAAGSIVTASPSGGYGNLVEIDHENGMATRYGHLSAILVSEGQKVEIGTLIGRVGSTGRSTGPHLHYEIRIDEEATDPARFLRAAKFLGQRD